jgi:feruloyl-CoA synthase
VGIDVMDIDVVGGATVPDLARDKRVIGWLTQRLAAFAGRGLSGSVARFNILTEPPNPDAGELSDKGSINQSISLARRRDDVERLYTAGHRVSAREAAPV